ncbi:MAG TPA: PHP domain-containing protein [Acidimicrobiia bacterium]|nr:PHP domain-containing protein [Acidimicrobiia bacterium]
MLEAPVDLHPHLVQPPPDGWVRVDCHLHTMYSGDAVTTLDELAERVEQARLDVVCVTDHNAVRGAVELLERDLACRVVVGEEVRTGAGEVIGLFLSERVPHGIDVRDAVARIRGQGGVVYVPHPFDPVRRCLHEDTLLELCGEGLVDAVEVFNAKVSLDSLNDRAAALAGEYALAGGAGSDAHDPAAIGAAYVEMPDFDGPADFLARLRDGRVVGHRFDRPRAFVPRIIPGGLTPS